MRLRERALGFYFIFERSEITWIVGWVDWLCRKHPMQTALLWAFYLFVCQMGLFPSRCACSGGPSEVPNQTDLSGFATEALGASKRTSGFRAAAARGLAESRARGEGRRSRSLGDLGVGAPPCSSHDRPAREDNTSTGKPPSGSRSAVARACPPPASPPPPPPQSAMKLTCLAAAGSGGGYHSPASYLLELEGLRFLLDCPIDLSVLAAFAPVPLGLNTGDTGDLISAVPYYWSPAAAAATKTGGVDAVLVSSATGMLGLPFLTRLPSFANTKVYVTELASRIGELMMSELVEMHSEFVRYYGPDIDGPPRWMEGEKVDKLLSVLQKVVNEDEVKDFAPLMPLYSSTNIDECVQKMQPVKYSEEVCFNGMLMLKASSSGLELGNCVWSIKGPRASITCLSSTVFVSAHALDFDYYSLKENDIILFSDFSSSNAMDEDNENLDENTTDENGTLLCHDSVLRDNCVNEDENAQYLCINDDIADEIERIGFICSCILDAIKSGGSVLIPIGRLGVVLLILEYISETLDFSNTKVPIFMISGAAEKIIAFTNAVPEWLCKPRQEKLFSGEALFGHAELLKEGRLSLFPHVYSKGLLAAWKDPCIVFCPHWSLRHVTAVHLLRRWHADKRNLLVLEKGSDAELALKPFMPLAMQVLECSFLSGMKARKVNPLMRVLKPKLVLFPEYMKSPCPLKEDSPWSFLHYSKGKTMEIPNIRDEFEVRLSTDAAFGLDENITIASLRGKLHLSNGQYVLVAPKDQSDRPKRQLMHWGAVDSDRVLSALQERGIVCSFPADGYSSEGHERSILVTSPGEALVKVTSERTVIYCDDEKTTKRIYDAFSSVCNGI